MLKPEERFFALEGSIYPGGPSTWYIMDWDQRRLVSVTMDEELESADPAVEHLSKHIDDLELDIFKIHVSSQGDLISTSTDPDDDNTFCPFYAPLEAIEKPGDIQVVPRSKLQELDRLGPLVDLVTDLQSSKPNEKLVFKYYFVYQRMSRVWNEMNLWMRLPKHPNIVSFDKIIIDELESRCVGFTTKYIEGGTLDQNRSRVFKLKWLLQLIAIIDELNLNLGVAHQDVALRNLLINTTDSLMIFDFNFSARIGDLGFSQARNDVDGVVFTVYELFTGEYELRSVEHEQQKVLDIEAIEWTKHPDVQLDYPVAEFRKVLDQWSSERRKDSHRINTYKDAPNYIEWPMPQPPPSEVVVNYTTGPVKEFRVLWSTERRDMLAQGKTVLNWQRPAQIKLTPANTF